jgi:cold-inducible RNA-binding protein
MKNVFVGNISFHTTENELRSLFETHGEVVRARVITDFDTGRSRGFGFVEMAEDGEADKAITAINGTEFGGRVLNVTEARPRPARDSRVAGRMGAHSGYGERRTARW